MTRFHGLKKKRKNSTPSKMVNIMCLSSLLVQIIVGILSILFFYIAGQYYLLKNGRFHKLHVTAYLWLGIVFFVVVLMIGIPQIKIMPIWIVLLFSLLFTYVRYALFLRGYYRYSDKKDRQIGAFLAVAGIKFNKNLKILWAGPEIEKVFGISPKYLIGNSLFDFVPSEDYRILNQLSDTTKGKAFPFVIEYRISIKHRSSYRWILQANQLEYAPNGQLESIFAGVKDITEEKMSKQNLINTVQELQETQERYHLATAVAGIGTWELDIETNKLFWSAETLAIMGVTEHSFDNLYRFWTNIISPEDRLRLAQEIRETTTYGTVSKMEYRIIRPIDKQERRLRQYMTRTMRQYREPHKILGVVFDITEESQQTEFLQLLKQTTDILPLGMTISKSDPSRKIVYVNHADAMLHQYHCEELIGQPVMIYAPSELQEFYRTLPQGMSYKNSRISLNITSNGEIFPVKLRSAIIRDLRQQPKYYVVLCEKLSETLLADLQEVSYKNSSFKINFTSPQQAGFININNWSIQLYNPALIGFLQFLGYKENDISAPNFFNRLLSEQEFIQFSKIDKTPKVYCIKNLTVLWTLYEAMQGAVLIGHQIEKIP